MINQSYPMTKEECYPIAEDGRGYLTVLSHDIDGDPTYYDCHTNKDIFIADANSFIKDTGFECTWHRIFEYDGVVMIKFRDDVECAMFCTYFSVSDARTYLKIFPFD